jgi:glycosyltransferase involved in cell wall biosynthesis
MRHRVGDEAALKIAFDEQIFEQQKYGGISRYYARLAQNLSPNLKVRIVAPFHFNAYLAELPAYLVTGWQLPQFRGFGRIARLLNAGLTPAIMKAYRPDIVHETYYSNRTPPSSRARKVLTVYDMIHEKFPSDFAADDPTARNKKVAVERADHICCVSQSTRNDLIAIHPSAANKSTVTLLGFDPIQTPPDVDTLIYDRPYLLFVGQRAGYKNFTGLLDAYAASPRLRADFDLIAIGGGAFQPTEREALHRHGLTDRVHQFAADDDALHRWYRGASVFVYPSLYEGFGIPPLEAMAAGTPVVAINVSSVPEICGNAAAYAQTSKADALREVVESVAYSNTLAIALREAALNQLAQFSWQKCAEQTTNVYRTLL